MDSWTKMAEIQPIISKIMMNSVKRKRLGHAYLLNGTKGIGKHHFGKLLAKTFFCENKFNDVEPCNQCTNCKRIQSGNHPDFHIVTPEDTLIKKEQIQYIQKEYMRTGMESNRKVIMIECCDKMSKGAANRLLKTIEEPVSEILTILTTDRISDVLPTIQSRTQVLNFQKLDQSYQLELLKNEGISDGTGRLILEITSDIDYGIELAKDEWFAQARRVVIQLYETLHIYREEAFIFVQTTWIPHFEARNREKNILGLDLLYFIFKDLLLHKLELNEYKIMPDYIHKNQDSIARVKILKVLDCITEAKNKIEQNANIQLTIESLILQLLEV